ncbi:ATP-dependent nuclease [Veillonella criceti]|uniref:Recombination protein F n=1 Tax=Veillonella criceti TaxID=103891 RepID=A0A380NLQ2_9FIRM|nr:AAA family ATPase [Veillonella criceti]SUP42717.1 recombination protein F [Veillonella criceti]
MYLATLEIENFRNLNHMQLAFHEQCNYLIGENAIGKSNLLALIMIITSGRSLAATDFFDVTKPVKVRLTLMVDPHETLPKRFVGAVNEGRILLEWEQLSVVARPQLYEVLTIDKRRQVPLRVLRYIPYLALRDIGLYTSTTKSMLRGSEAAVAEVDRGEHSEAMPSMADSYVALRDVLGHALERVLTRDGDGSHKSMSRIALRIRQFRMVMPHLPDYMIIVLAQLTQWPLLARGSMIDKKVLKAGLISGIYAGFYTPDALRLITLVVLRVVRQIFSLVEGGKFESHIIMKRGKRYLPLIVSLDEVEAHLNPLMQRAMVDYFKEILANENIGFLRILKDVFDVDGLLGQLFIVTHSAEVLSDDYRQIIRFYRQPSGSVKIACGVTFDVSSEAEEHLIAYFSAVKEALYTRCVMIVEGETEYSSFRQFAKTLGIPFDFYGIGLINARGQGSISRLVELFNRFDIPVIALYDRDVRTDAKASKKQVYFTDTICYEFDLVHHLISRNRRDILDDIVRMVINLEGGSSLVSKKAITQGVDKLIKYAKAQNESLQGLVNRAFHERKLNSIPNREIHLLEIYYFSWLFFQKGITIGKCIAYNIKEREDIPPAFVKVIKKAQQLAQQQDAWLAVEEETKYGKQNI